MKLFKEEILALVLAGGRGKRLSPLTLDRTKPSVPFGGKYRIIDFALSNFVNSDIYSIYLLVQYKSQSLIEHIRTTWSMAGMPSKHFLTVVPPQMRKEEVEGWYRGTADSVYQNINLIYDFKPKIVAVFSGDHVYRMDIRKMVEFHLKRKAELTVSMIPLDPKDAHQFGVLEVDGDKRITEFKEKPQTIDDKPYYASMGNYIFNTDALIEALEANAVTDSSHDFGKDIIPAMLQKNQGVYGYDCSQNKIPSLKNYESKFYWRDVGTIKSYWEANMDLLGDKSVFDLDNQAWPIYASNLNCPPAFVADSQVERSLLCEGTKIFSSSIKNCILGRAVRVEPGCDIENSIIMDFTVINKGCRIKNAIVDRFNAIEKNTMVGYDFDSDAKNYNVDPSGIVVVKRGPRKSYYF
jgi:glucose-1-phosphate adenylyltransferase